MAPLRLKQRAALPAWRKYNQQSMPLHASCGTSCRHTPARGAAGALYSLCYWLHALSAPQSGLALACAGCYTWAAASSQEELL